MAVYIVTLLRHNGSNKNSCHDDVESVHEELQNFFDHDEYRTFVVNLTREGRRLLAQEEERDD